MDTTIVDLFRPDWKLLSLAYFIMFAGELWSLYNPLLLAKAYDLFIDSTAAGMVGSDNNFRSLCFCIVCQGVLCG